ACAVIERVVSSDQVIRRSRKDRRQAAAEKAAAGDVVFVCGVRVRILRGFSCARGPRAIDRRACVQLSRAQAWTVTQGSQARQRVVEDLAVGLKRQSLAARRGDGVPNSGSRSLHVYERAERRHGVLPENARPGVDRTLSASEARYGEVQ